LTYSLTLSEGSANAVRLPQEIIRRKRDGLVLLDEEIAQMVAGLVDGSISEGQAAAFAMAIYFQGMELSERVALTRSMMNSGRVMTWDDLDGPVVDKHSTGGVGDTVSLMLAPIVAGCGVHVPMISGRGLGHTGGTMDKMASIPGYQVTPDPELFHSVVRKVGCAVIGQTADLAPADRRLYAIRDVTATVESIPLITASILSKKLAAGLDGLVMDVKFGNGAFMAERSRAQELADALVEVAAGAGLPTTAMLTDMSQPLASAAGNACEVRYAIDYLTGARREPRMHEVTMSLAAAMLQIAGLAASEAAARRAVEESLDQRAVEIFAAMVSALGGPSDLVERPDQYLDRAPITRTVTPELAGSVGAIDARGVGLVVVSLGGGRTRPSDEIDPGVGLVDIAEVGQEVGPDRPLAVIWARSNDDADRAEAQLRECFSITGSAAAGAAH
jgi:thymidine phosphorylase